MKTGGNEAKELLHPIYGSNGHFGSIHREKSDDDNKTEKRGKTDCIMKSTERWRSRQILFFLSLSKLVDGSIKHEEAANTGQNILLSVAHVNFSCEKGRFNDF